MNGKLYVIPERRRSPQRAALAAFTAQVDETEDFVVVARTKDGRVRFIPCLDPQISIVEFLELAKTDLLAAIRWKLEGKQCV